MAVMTLRAYALMLRPPFVSLDQGRVGWGMEYNRNRFKQSKLEQKATTGTCAFFRVKKRLISD